VLAFFGAAFALRENDWVLKFHELALQKVKENNEVSEEQNRGPKLSDLN